MASVSCVGGWCWWTTRLFREGIYWRIETFVKMAESDFGSVIGANGAIYLFRRNYELFRPTRSTMIFRSRCAS
jgi:hypothetical protein